MMIKLKNLGNSTSNVEIQISEHGVWLLINHKEYFLSYKEYSWFKDAKLPEVHNVKLLFGSHLHWPDLGVDLELKSLENPENYPLTYKTKS